MNYTTKEIAKTFDKHPSVISNEKNHYLKEGKDFDTTGAGIIWKESAVEFFKKKFNMPDIKIKKIKKFNLNKFETKVKDFSKLEYSLSKLPVGSYMLSELFEWYSKSYNTTKPLFSKMVKEYCKSFDPIIKKRGENFYDKGVESPLKTFKED